jgi:hypothetical protein
MAARLGYLVFRERAATSGSATARGATKSTSVRRPDFAHATMAVRDALAHLVAILLWRNPLADGVERRCHVGHRSLIELNQHGCDPFALRPRLRAESRPCQPWKARKAGPCVRTTQG